MGERMITLMMVIMIMFKYLDTNGMPGTPTNHMIAS